MLAYLRMLAVNRLAVLTRSRTDGKKPTSKAKKVWKWIGIGALVLYIYAVILFLEMMIYRLGVEIGQPELVIAITFLGCTVITLFYSFFYVVSILFFSKDTTFLGALPITSTGIMTAKLLVVLGGEIGITLLIAAPLLIRYGIESAAGIGFYMRALVGTVFIPVVPVTLSALLSGLLIRISGLWKRRESVTIIFSFLLMGGLIYFQMSMSTKVDSSQVSALAASLLFGKESLTEMLLKYYPPLRWVFEGITGGGLIAWGKVLLFAGVSVAAFVLIVGAFGKSYMRLALKQQESIRRANTVRRKLGADRIRTPFRALLKQELRDVISVPVYATNCLAGAVIFPIAIIFMVMQMRDQLPGDNLAAMLLNVVPSSLLTAIICGVMCFTTTMCQAGATSISREGKQHDIRKSFPISGYTHLSAKLCMSMIYGVIGSVCCTIALLVLAPSLWKQALIGFAVSQVFSLLFNALSLMLDVYRPRLNWKSETEAVKQNTNTLLSMLIGIGLVVALAGIFILMLQINPSTTLALVVVVIALIIASAVSINLLRTKASRVYYLR